MQSHAEKIWTGAQEMLRTMLNADIYNLWFLPIKAKTMEADSIVLEVANDFCEVWLKDNYLGLLKDVLRYSAGQSVNIKFQIAHPLPHPKASEPASSRIRVEEEP